ncbi:MAG: enoyl-CoA hydratase [Candidatus Dactylopiibacterium carminicum]|uniref:Enoyl-CoA hydratase n=1 Tax=Candidatus Dactylopiibacterium carminicum TaxID=857335 RepID=A0A272ETF0_9RHOO|nr:bifunctional enoyl-CoA hydratase/phosphate acetyltransferase [Candidatus Dactylopiibacterium carminicum]KAF7599335.1 enoyl-CoA hydratase [Candidatus Dactylopiibacterium carminicum]PAS93326.1 MAG: enoyl-CoA hydratase [Candidatus Dactylopiibacterium carminicum]PAS95704.1 MAG: enoyl-CoA hydratase [Candidatus Dactylopiibacterium carminicum]PAS99339.1 MAG: enoyl-CoA hydratase [Candidatus Dactylopiibacterium carminicum]
MDITNPPLDTLENLTFDEIRVGDTATLSRTVHREDIQLFALVSGDVNPTHLDSHYARESQTGKVTAHGMLSAAMISALLGNQFPGPGTVYVAQSLRFKSLVHIDDTLTVRLICTEKLPEQKHLVIACVVTNQDDVLVAEGEAVVAAPIEKIRRPRAALPEVTVTDRQQRYEDVLALAAALPPIRVAVAHPCDAESLKGALQAKREGLIIPVLVGPETRIRATAEQIGESLEGCRLVDTEHSVQSAETAVALVRAGEVEALMKGSLHTDELMSQVVHKTTGIRTGRRISHCFVADVPRYPRTLLITDAAINIQPELADMVDIVQNAIDLAHAINIPLPRVALLSAVETVNPKIPSTQIAASLCKMADRGQIKGGLLDGPLAFDNAVSAFAARTKGITSEVAGRADILVVPDLESGNMLAKQLEYLAGGLLTGVVLGARVPIVLTSRADRAETRSASCAIVKRLVAHRNQAATP